MGKLTLRTLMLQSLRWQELRRVVQFHIRCLELMAMPGWAQPFLRRPSAFFSAPQLKPIPLGSFPKPGLNERPDVTHEQRDFWRRSA